VAAFNSAAGDDSDHETPLQGCAAEKLSGQKDLQRPPPADGGHKTSRPAAVGQAPSFA